MGGRDRAPEWPRWNHSFASIAETQRELNPELSLTHTNGPSAERCRRTEQSAEGVSLVRSGAYVTTTDSREGPDKTPGRWTSLSTDPVPTLTRTDPGAV